MQQGQSFWARSEHSVWWDLQAPEAAQKRLIGLMTTGEYQQLPAPPKRGGTSVANPGLETAQARKQDAQPLQSRARIIVTTQQAVQLPAACKIQQIKVRPPDATSPFISPASPNHKRVAAALKLLQLLLY